VPRIDSEPARDLTHELVCPVVSGSANPWLALRVQQGLNATHEADHELGSMESLAIGIACIQGCDDHAPPRLRFERPQLLVFAADHGVADEGVSPFRQEASRQRVLQLLTGCTPVNALAACHGFDLTLVDAGLASNITLPPDGAAQVPFLMRKIGYGTRNTVLAQAMSLAQAHSALHAGMDAVRHLPGNVLALSSIGVAGDACAALMLSRMCAVPLSEACGKDQEDDPAFAQHKLERLSVAASRHRKAKAPLEVLAAMGGFEIGMLCGAMIQAASERRVILVDGFVPAAAALLARVLVPAVADYLVFAHCSAQPGHRLLLMHLQARPLLDLGLRTDQGVGALLAWPLLLAAQRLLEPR
jgi:nicotinate-nucleotide--dimethylbenzimidazole phosphoribosyltransferase